MELEAIFEDVITGRKSLNDLSDWIQRNKAFYEQPDLFGELINSLADEQRSVVDRYADWEGRVHSVRNILTKYGRLANTLEEESIDQAILIATARTFLVELIPFGQNVANAQFQLGYLLWKAKKFFDAVEPFTHVLEACQTNSESVDTSLELSTLSFLSDSLLGDRQFDMGLNIAKQFLALARRIQSRGYEALALKDMGQNLTYLGRSEEALETLCAATGLRKKLTKSEVQDASVVSVGRFLYAYGMAARQFSNFELAIGIFSEMADIESHNGASEQHADAVSEIAYTYQRAGDMEKTKIYLQEAISIIEQHDISSANSTRWRLQLQALSHNQTASSEVSARGPTPFLADTIHDSETAYLRSVLAEKLLFEGNYEEARRKAMEVIDWATYSKDYSLEITALNLLGTIYRYQGVFDASIKAYQRGIKVSDQIREGATSMGLRYNLAKVYILKQNYKASFDVLMTGIIYSQNLLDQTETSGFRQQIIAGSIGLYELAAYLLCVFDAEENRPIFAMITELARARNLKNWIQMNQSTFMTGLAPEKKAQAENLLNEMRSIEVELDLRHITKNIPVIEMNELRRRMVKNHENIEALLESPQQNKVFFFEKDALSTSTTEKMIETVLKPEEAILLLFSVQEGICYNILYKQDARTTGMGGFIQWDRQDREQVLTPWMRKENVEDMGGVVELSYRLPLSGDLMKLDIYRQGIEIFQTRLMNEVTTKLREIAPKKLCVVPHRELALIPYWDILDQCPSLIGFQIAPSLGILDLCNRRERNTKGSSFILSDFTQSLDQVGKEINFVKEVRKEDPIYELSSVEDFQSHAPECSLIHIATHGLFNVENPYYSGFMISDDLSNASMLSQFVSLPHFEMSHEPSEYSIRLMTVAECMSQLHMGQCRLAVLSTCESGIARPHEGGELTGLPNAMLVAGAKTVVASLWPVLDTATSLLMIFFYQSWAGGCGAHESPASALSQARRALRETTREHALEILGDQVVLPPGEFPFDNPLYLNAFQCFGSW